MLLFPEPVAADFARVQPIAFKACLLRAQRRFHATGYTRAGRVNTQTTHKCSVERAKAGVCCRILPARGLWRAHPVVPPCRAPASRAAYFADIPFFVRRVPSKAMLVTGFGNTTKKRAAFLPPRPEIKRIPRSLFLDIPFINPYNKHREFPCNIKIAAGWSVTSTPSPAIRCHDTLKQSHQGHCDQVSLYIPSGMSATIF